MNLQDTFKELAKKGTLVRLNIVIARGIERSFTGKILEVNTDHFVFKEANQSHYPESVPKSKRILFPNDVDLWATEVLEE